MDYSVPKGGDPRTRTDLTVTTTSTPEGRKKLAKAGANIRPQDIPFWDKHKNKFYALFALIIVGLGITYFMSQK